MFRPVAITLLFYITRVLTEDFTGTISKCKEGDSECLTKTFNDLHPVVLAGIPSLGVGSSDPMFLDEIEGDFPTLKYKYSNTTVRGLKDCAVKNVIFSYDMSHSTYEMDCPKFSISGHYEMNGTLITVPVVGKGTFNTVTGKYLIQVEENINNAADNKTQMLVKDLKIEALEPIQFDFKNLFNGQKDLSDAAHKFAHDNWKKVSELLHETILRKNIDVMYFNINKFMNTVPFEDFFVE